MYTCLVISKVPVPRIGCRAVWSILDFHRSSDADTLGSHKRERERERERIYNNMGHLGQLECLPDPATLARKQAEFTPEKASKNA